MGSSRPRSGSFRSEERAFDIDASLSPGAQASHSFAGYLVHIPAKLLLLPDTQPMPSISSPRQNHGFVLQLTRHVAKLHRKSTNENRNFFFSSLVQDFFSAGVTEASPGL